MFWEKVVLFKKGSSCTHSCAWALGCGVYAPWGWWLWEVGAGYRLPSGGLHCSQRGQLPLPSCGQGGLQQDTQGTQFNLQKLLQIYFFSNAWTILLLSAHLSFFLGCGSQHCAFKRARDASAGVGKESPCLHPRKHQVRAQEVDSSSCPSWLLDAKSLHVLLLSTDTLWFQEHQKRFLSTSWSQWEQTYTPVNQVPD